MTSEDDKKLYVAALPQEANDSDIKEYFEQFGEIDSINLKMDPMTGRPRGFAFIVFKGLEGLEGALEQADHVVKGKKVTCKKAEPKNGRIHLGGLTSAISDHDIREALTNHGTVKDIFRPQDRTYALVRMEQETIALQLIHAGKIDIKNQVFSVNKVQPLDKTKAKPPSDKKKSSSVADMKNTSSVADMKNNGNRGRGQGKSNSKG